VTAGTEILAGVGNELQHRDAMVEQPLSGVGQRNAAAVAQKQLLAHLGLQRPDLAAQRRLRDVERHRRLAETAELGHLNEIFELLEVHAPPLCSKPFDALHDQYDFGRPSTFSAMKLNASCGLTGAMRGIMISRKYRSTWNSLA